MPEVIHKNSGKIHLDVQGIPYKYHNTTRNHPASAPCQFVRFQNKANNTTGPNTAPNPAHAKDTMLNTELSGLRAMITATTAIKSNVTRSATILSFLSAFFFRIFPRRSEDTAEEAARSCESAVDITAARIPQINNPAINGIGIFSTKIFWIISINTDSADGAPSVLRESPDREKHVRAVRSQS